MSDDMNVHLNLSGMIRLCKTPDAEWAKIIRRLWEKYGIKSTGSKSGDRAKLHELELREAKQLNYVSSKFLTVTKGEQEKIQAKKKEKRIEREPEKYKDTSAKGAKILGEQIFLAIKMKQEKEEKEKKKKYESKIESTHKSRYTW